LAGLPSTTKAVISEFAPIPLAPLTGTTPET
jgi:hypothetical protein